MIRDEANKDLDKFEIKEDLSNVKELRLSDNKLTSIQLNNTSSLRRLDLTQNELSSIDLSPCTNLKKL